MTTNENNKLLGLVGDDDDDDEFFDPPAPTQTAALIKARDVLKVLANPEGNYNDLTKKKPGYVFASEAGQKLAQSILPQIEAAIQMEVKENG